MLNEFRTTVETTIKDAKRTLQIGWDELVVCEEKNPCCEHSEVQFCNLQLQIWETRKRLEELKVQWISTNITRIDSEKYCEFNEDWVSQFMIETKTQMCPDMHCYSDLSMFDYIDRLDISTEAPCKGGEIITPGNPPRIEPKQDEPKEQPKEEPKEQPKQDEPKEQP